MNFFKKNNVLMKLSIFVVFLFVSFYFVHIFTTAIVYAQSIPSDNPPAAITSSNPSNSTCLANQLCNPLKVNSIQSLLYLLVDIATYIGVILAVLALIWVGFKFIAAQGNPEKLKEARGFFYAIIIGIAVLIGANAIITIIENTLTSAGVVQPGVFGNPQQ